MREPPVKKVLYWCEECNVPLVGKTCACRKEGKRIELLQPYDVRPALAADTALIKRLITGAVWQRPAPEDPPPEQDRRGRPG